MPGSSFHAVLGRRLRIDLPECFGRHLRHLGAAITPSVLPGFPHTRILQLASLKILKFGVSGPDFIRYQNHIALPTTFARAAPRGC